MISIKRYLMVIALLSTISCSKITYHPSKITVNENFRKPIALPPGYPGAPSPINNFVHEGTNFFFNPQFLLGGYIPPPLGTVIASIKPSNDKITGSWLEDNIKVPTGENKTLVVAVSEDLRKPLEITVEENRHVSLSTLIPFQVTESTTVEEEVNRTVPAAPLVEETVDEVIEPHDIIAISADLQPVLRPEIVATQQLLSIPEAPVLPPLVIPKLSVKVSIEEPVPVPVVLPSMSESKLYIPIGPPNVPLLTESNENQPFKKEIDYKANKIPTAPELPPLFLTNYLHPVPVSNNKTLVLIPTTPKIPSIIAPDHATEIVQVNVPLSAVYAHNIVEERVIPNMFKISEKTTTKGVEILPIPISFHIPVRTPIVT